MAKTNKQPEMKISADKKKATVALLGKAENLAAVKAAVAELEPAERNALAPQIKEAIDKIVGL